MTLDWIGGFFDGEGSVSLASRQRSYGNRIYFPVLTIFQTNEEILARIRDTVNVECHMSHQVHEKHKDQFGLHWSNKRAVEVAEILLPHVILKRTQLELVIDHYHKYLNYTKGWRKNPEEYSRRVEENQAASMEVRSKLLEIRKNVRTIPV